MTKPTKEAAVLERHHYQGQIRAGGSTAPISFYLSAGSDCRLTFEAEPLDPQTYSTLITHDMGRPGQSIEYFSMSGRSADGYEFSSDSCFLTSFNSGPNGRLVGIAAQGQGQKCHQAVHAVAPRVLRVMR